MSYNFESWNVSYLTQSFARGRSASTPSQPERRRWRPCRRRSRVARSGTCPWRGKRSRTSNTRRTGRRRPATSCATARLSGLVSGCSRIPPRAPRRSGRRTAPTPALECRESGRTATVDVKSRRGKEKLRVERRHSTISVNYQECCITDATIA